MQPYEKPVVNVLAVATEEPVLKSVSSTLGKAGFAVVGAPDAVSALLRCRETRPALAIVDATRPGIDLHELVFQLHQIVPGIRVLLLSGDTPSEVLLGLRARWQAKLLKKPFRRSQLLGLALELMDEPLVLTA